MQRRTFGLGLMAAGVAGSAVADEDKLVPRIAPFGRLTIQRGSAQVQIEAVLIPTSGRTLVSKLGFDIPQFDEDRIASGGVITRATPAERIRGTAPAGRVVLRGKSLVVVLDAPSVPPPRSTVVISGDISWEPPRLQAANVSGLPPIPQLSQLPAIGFARKSDSQLIILIKPVIGLRDSDY